MNTLLKYVPIEEATGEVKEIYEEIISIMGMVPAPVKQHSINPELLKSLWDMFKGMSNPNISPKLVAIARMLIALKSDIKCSYCIGFNENILIKSIGMNEAEVEAIKEDPMNAKLDEKDQAMLKLMLDSTRSPERVTTETMVTLRELSWNDKDIFDALKYSTQMMAMILMVSTLKISKDF